MKKICTALTILLLVSSLAVTACAQPTPAPTPTPTPTPAKEIVWRLNSWQPPLRVELGFMQLAADEIDERSNGRLKIEIYPAFSLGYDYTTWMRDMKEGIIDISQLYTSYTAGEEPSFSIVEMPQIWTTREQGLLALDALFDWKKKVYHDVWNSELIASGTILDKHGELFTRGRQVTKVEDVKGLKIRTYGARFREVFTNLGAAPQMLPQSELYMALKTGVVDGYLTGSASCYLVKFYEVTDYCVRMNPWEALTQDIVVSNKQWDALPPDLQQIVRDVFSKVTLAMKARAIHGMEDDYWKAKCEKEGVVYTEFPDTEKAKLRDMAMDVFLAWINKEGGRVAEAYDIIRPLLVPPQQPGSPDTAKELFGK